MIKVWISKKKWEELKKKVADLEKQVQDQPFKITDMVLQQLRTELQETIQKCYW